MPFPNSQNMLAMTLPTVSKTFKTLDKEAHGDHLEVSYHRRQNCGGHSNMAANGSIQTWQKLYPVIVFRSAYATQQPFFHNFTQLQQYFDCSNINQPLVSNRFLQAWETLVRWSPQLSLSLFDRPPCLLWNEKIHRFHIKVSSLLYLTHGGCLNNTKIGANEERNSISGRLQFSPALMCLRRKLTIALLLALTKIRAYGSKALG